jgi:hypothetical protein
MSTKVILLNALKEIKAEVKSSPYGICSNVLFTEPGASINRELEIDVKQQLYSLFPKWKHFSGDLQVPIEGKLPKYNRQRDKFKKTTKYGRLRHNLLNFLIKELSNEVNS